MRAVLLSLAALCWGYGQVLSTALHKYYSPEGIAEIKEKTPLKWEAIQYEFSESYEVYPPPGTSSEALEAFLHSFDPRQLERDLSEDREYHIGAYRVVLKSVERARAELCARFPEECKAATSRPEKTSKLARP